MKKSLTLSLFITVSLSTIALATDSKSTNFKLDNKIADAYKINETSKTSTQKLEKATKQKTPSPNHKIIKENILGGYVEKLLDDEGLVIAEKKVVDNKIIESTINEYHPNKKISKKIISRGEDNGFYVEEYYPNGNISKEASYINDQNKLGIEKRYDTKGVLRQEIPWVAVNDKTSKTNAEITTKREGELKTYYPNSKIAAIFSVGKKGNNIFLNEHGGMVKHISNAELLDFSKEDLVEDCQGISLKLNIEELVSLYEDEGDISYNKCGLPYRESFVYELNDINGKAITVVSFDETGMIRKITPYINGYKHGTEQKFDRQGNLTAEITYVEGKKEGKAIGYYPTNEIAFRKNYKDNKVEGHLTCYFPTGEEAAVIPYKNGIKDGVAKVSSPNPKGVEFRKGKILGFKRKPRKLVSKLKDASLKDANQCLNIEEKKQSIENTIKTQENRIRKSFEITLPKECEDLSEFEGERSRYVCYKDEKVLASYPPEYNKRQYAVVSYFYDNSLKQYEIPYNDQKRQGITKIYDEKQKVIKEISFDKGELKDTSRTYYPNGVTENMLSLFDDNSLILVNNYNEDGKLNFSLNYEKNERKHAYINQADKNKNVYVNFYEDKLDNIREVNNSNPLNFIDYDLALNEYGVYKDGDLIKAGKICKIENKAETLGTPTLGQIKNTQTREEKELQKAINELDKEMIELSKENSKPTLKAEPKEEIKTETKQELKVEPKEEIKTETKPALKVEPKEEIKTETKPALKVEPKEEIKEAVNSVSDINIEIPPVIEAKDAPMVIGLEPVSKELPVVDKNDTKNTTTSHLEQKDKLPRDAKDMSLSENSSIKANTTQAVGEVQEIQKEPNSTPIEIEQKNKENINKIYYPNGNIRKIIKTNGEKNEEIKEYSKTGLLTSETIYNKDSIVNEKYYGTGELRKKTIKNYTDNTVMSFIKRQDFYVKGNIRYEILRQEGSLLFTDKEFYPNSNIKTETIQTTPLSLIKTEYNDKNQKQKETIINGANVLVKEYDVEQKVKNLTLNDKQMPVNIASNSKALLEDNAKNYGKGGALLSEFKQASNKDMVLEYFPSGSKKIEIIFFANGEITIKKFLEDGTVDKEALLNEDGDFYIQKPQSDVIKSFRQRYWVDYNNPHWIENSDKYSITSIPRLTLDVAAYMLVELDIEVPDILKNIYSVY